MRSTLAVAAVTLLALAGCSSSEPELAMAPPSEATTATPAEPTEEPIALGEPFTIAGPNCTADVTIERVYIPAMCGDAPNSSLAIEANVSSAP